MESTIVQMGLMKLPVPSAKVSFHNPTEIHTSLRLLRISISKILISLLLLPMCLLDNESGTILGLEVTWFVVVVVSTVLVLLVLIVAVSICICRRNCSNTRPIANAQQPNASYSCKCTHSIIFVQHSSVYYISPYCIISTYRLPQTIHICRYNVVLVKFNCLRDTPS